MKSSRPTYPSIPNPYPPTASVAPGPQQPLDFVNTGYQAQEGKFLFYTSPEIFSSNQQGQGNTAVINEAIETAVKTFKEEGKSLGAVQIIIGLLHIGFGVILGLICYSYSVIWVFTSTAFVGGYPFWGGISFIISGTLSTSASKELSPGLIKGTLGMNIVSAIFALAGVILLLLDQSINGDPKQDYQALLPGRGISGMLTIFSLLEFSIACATAHSANQIIIHANRTVLTVPNVFMINPMSQESSMVSRRYDGLSAYAPRY